MHILTDARNFLYWAEESGLVDRAPVPRRWLPRVPEREPDCLLDEEVDRVVSVADPHGFVVRLALGTGMRWGDLSRAQARDLQNGMLVVGQTKSGRVRRIPISDQLYREIRCRVGRLVPFFEGVPRRPGYG